MIAVVVMMVVVMCGLGIAAEQVHRLQTIDLGVDEVGQAETDGPQGTDGAARKWRERERATWRNDEDGGRHHIRVELIRCSM